MSYKRNPMIGIISLCIFILSFNSTVFAKAGDSVKVKLFTKTYFVKGKEGAFYSPRNCVMVWIQKSDNTYIKTILKRVEKQIIDMSRWLSISDADTVDFDGMTGATRNNHNDTLRAVWDCTGQDGKPVEDGEYEIWAEMTEDHRDKALGKLSHGTIAIGGDTIPDTVDIPIDTTGFKYFNAVYIPGPPSSVKKSTKLPMNDFRLTLNNQLLSVEFPKTGSYSISVLSPSGREIASGKGTGTKASLELGKNHLKTGVYLIKLSQSGNTRTRPLLIGF